MSSQSPDFIPEMLIVAAGRGTRAGVGVPKQYRPLAGKPVLAHTVAACLKSSEIAAVRVVIHPDDRAFYEDAIQGIDDARLREPVTGGESRSASVRAGLAACSGSHVLIHDGARPLLAQGDIAALLSALRGNRAAVLAVPVVDALWHEGPGGQADRPQSRDGLWRAQTPQGFALSDIRAAHAGGGAFADDVEAARAMGLAVTLVPGTGSNLKITHAEDFSEAEKLMTQTLDVRTGNGYDVHKFGPGDHVTLCGVTIAHSHGLVGHSDADVAMHTLTDAIFGALAEGDIGQWFPPSDMQWKGAASAIFLEKAMERVAARGFVLTHMDVTIVCEFPKIGPHTEAMRASLAGITGVAVDRISVKATTSEKLGFTGRGEGIAALATATLVAA